MSLKNKIRFKRIFDIVLSIIALILLSPIFIITSILIKLNLGNPIFFKQKRIGLDGKNFEIIKFRTMTNETDENGEILDDIYRKTPLGNILRDTSLDEIPELINVLKGEMSLVGPRPLLAEYRDDYSKEQFRRHDIRPGITGWAQINGRTNISWEKTFKLDVWYVDHLSLFLDIKIMFITIYKVIKKSDMENNRGNIKINE